MPSDRNNSRAPESTTMRSSAAAATMVESGTMQHPARIVPAKISTYSGPFAARIATLSPRRRPAASSALPTWLTRASKSAQQSL